VRGRQCESFRDLIFIFASVRPCSLVMQLLRLHWRRAANAEWGGSVPVLLLVCRFLAVGMAVLFSFFLFHFSFTGMWESGLASMFNID
jgi:hypothetical protein